jgi:hypothetical protein
MALFLQLLPVLVGALNAGLFFLQISFSNTYPWIVFSTPILFAITAAAMLWQRRRHADFRSLLPATVTLTCCAYGLLLSEGVLLHWIIPVFAGSISYYLLHLIFLSVFVPARYPVNGITHANLAMVPIALWLSAFTSFGLAVFMDVSHVVPLAVMAGACFLLFYGTSHPESDAKTRWRWVAIGSWIGLQIGILLSALPVSMETAGACAALLGGFALRVRRYGIAPPIARRIVITETLCALGLLILILALASWR